MVGCSWVWLVMDGNDGSYRPMGTPYIVPDRNTLSPSSHARTSPTQRISHPMIDPSRVQSIASGRCLIRPTPVPIKPQWSFHLHHLTFPYLVDLSHSLSLFPQMITCVHTLLFFLIFTPVSAPIPYLSSFTDLRTNLSPFSITFPLRPFHLSCPCVNTWSVRSACPTPSPLYSGSVLPVFP